MPLIKYVDNRFSTSSRDIIAKANNIIAEYIRQGFKLTLRQLYYQFVSRDYIPNTVKSYKRIGSIINDARLAGLIDWNSIEDRTREVKSLSHWDDPSELISSCASWYRVDKWSDQKYRPEVWIEKEALAGVIEGVCEELDIPFLSCRGYTSQSEMWSSAMRLKEFKRNGQIPYIIHFGDHDPSGVDMSRDIQDRLEIFGCEVDFRRVALNMSQVKTYNPPPNPAKQTDSRFKEYRDKYGEESWELDALEPSVIGGIIRKEVTALRDSEKLKAKEALERSARRDLTSVAHDWDDIVARIND